VNGVVELKFRRDSKSGSCYPWFRLRHLDKGEMARANYELKEENSKVIAVTIKLEKNWFWNFLARHA